jgi:uncharacterized membrane protein YhhN
MMNPATTGALVVAAVFAVGNWIAVSRDDRTPANGRGERQRLEYVCKPGTLLALIVAAAALDPAAGADARQHWFVAALAFSLVGDVLLMLPSDQFVGGLSAFFVAHVCYVAGFWSHGPAAGALLVAVAVTVVVIGLLGRKILGAVRVQDRALAGPVAAYMVVIGAMLATALAVGNPVAAAGAVLFVASDSMIAWDRFVAKVPNASLLIMVTYHLGQAGLVLSLLR